MWWLWVSRSRRGWTQRMFEMQSAHLEIEIVSLPQTSLAIQDAISCRRRAAIDAESTSRSSSRMLRRNQ